MCRLLGVVSRAQAPLPDLLGDTLAQFTALAAEHKDGWGVAYADGPQVNAVKEELPAHTSAAFARTVKGIATDAAALHIRLANPGSPLTWENTHPFTAGAMAFAHNGDFSPSEAVDSLIDPELLADARGTTDSERLFLLVRMHLRDSDPATALALAAMDIRARARYSGLNCLLLTPDALYAYVESDPDSEVSRRRGPEYFPLRFRVEPDRVVVTSTGYPQPADEWTVLEEREVLEIRRSSLRVTRHRVSLAAAGVAV